MTPGPNDLPLLILILGTTALYLLVHFCLASHGGKRHRVFIHKLGGGALFLGGGICLLVLIDRSPLQNGLWAGPLTPLFSTWPALGGLAALILPFLYLASRGLQIQDQYPEIREELWTPELALKSAGAWAVYLLGYEFLFRGALLFPLVDWMGMYPALAIMTAMYALAHLNKSASEALACLPMGIVFGLLAINAGSIWPAWLLHWTIAVISENAAVAHHPTKRWLARL
jgi:membrane protease YdiL (CAAX protease family)